LGAVPAPDGYFKGMKAICEKYGVLFISDEVFCGFGRTGRRFGIENYDVIPDIIAAGKGIGGGYFPLSAVLASAKVMAPFIDTNSSFLGGHTFACNPVGAAVGLKVLDIIDEEQIIANAQNMGTLLMNKLQGLLALDVVGDVRGVGLQCGIELVQDKLTKKPFPVELNISKRIGERSIEKGVVLYPGSGSVDGRSGNHILITPPLTVSENELDEIVSVLQICIKEISAELTMEKV
jgi:adenosylmethionine-8-amino-7-oxononanoate aminotransferase